MRAEELFEIIDGIDDDLILDIPRLRSERPIKVVIEHRKTPVWALVLLSACLVCVLAVGVFFAAKLQGNKIIDPGSYDPDHSNSSDNSGSDSDSDSESRSDIDDLIENFPVDNITFPDGSTVSKYEADWARNENKTYELGFDYSFIRYAKAPLYTTVDDPELYNWEKNEFKGKKEVIDNPDYYKVKAGDKLSNGLTVKSASYSVVPSVETSDTVTFDTHVEYEGQLTLYGILYCYSGDNPYINEMGKYMFFMDPSRSSYNYLPITSMGNINNEGKMGPLDHEELMSSSYEEDNFAAQSEYVIFEFNNIDDIQMNNVMEDGEAVNVTIKIENISTSYALTGMRMINADLAYIERRSLRNSFIAPDGNRVYRSEAVNEDHSSDPVFDFTYIRYAKPVFRTTIDEPDLIDWESGKDERYIIEDPDWFRVYPGDKLPNGLVVSSARYIFNGYYGYAYESGISFDGELTLTGVLSCHKEDGNPFVEHGDVSFLADSAEFDSFPILVPCDDPDFISTILDKEANFARTSDSTGVYIGNINEIDLDLSGVIVPGEYKKVKVTITNINAHYYNGPGRSMTADLVSVELI